MKPAALLTLSLLLSSCTTNYSLPVFNLGRTVEPVYCQNDNYHLYRADEQWYVKGWRCTYTHYTTMESPVPVNVIPFVDMGRLECPWYTTVDGGGNPEQVYLPVHPDSYADVQQLLSGRSIDHPLKLNPQTYLTTLPAPHRCYTTPYQKIHYLPGTSRSWGKTRTSAHALWAYPLGVATAIAIDVPASLLTNVLFLPVGVCIALTDAGDQQAPPPLPPNMDTPSPAN